MSDEVKKLGIEIDVSLKGDGAKQAEQELKAVTDAAKKDGEETAAASEKAKTALDEQIETWRKLKAEREANIKITDASSHTGDGQPVNLPAGSNTGAGLAGAAPDLEREAAAIAAADQAAKTFTITTEAEYVAVRKAHDALSAKIPVLLAAGKDTAEYVAAQKSLSAALSTNSALTIAETLEKKAAAAATLENAAANKVLDESVNLNTVSMREMTVIARELANGNFSRLPGSVSILAGQFNLLKYVFSAAGGAAIGAGAAVYLLFQHLKDMNQVLDELGQTAANADFLPAIEAKLGVLQNAVMAADSYVLKLRDIKAGEHDVATELKAQLELSQAIERARASLDSAQKGLAVARIQQQENSGQLTPAQAEQARVEIEKFYTAKEQADREKSQDQGLKFKQEALLKAQNVQPELEKAQREAANAVTQDATHRESIFKQFGDMAKYLKDFEAAQKQLQEAQKKWQSVQWNKALGGGQKGSTADFELRNADAQLAAAEAHLNLVRRGHQQYLESISPESIAQTAALKHQQEKATEAANQNAGTIASLQDEVKNRSQIIAETRPIERQAVGVKNETLDTQSATRSRSLLEQDVETIQNYSTRETLDPKIIQNASRAIKDFYALISEHREFVNSIGQMGITVKDVVQAQEKIMRELAQVRQMAEHANANANLH